MSAMSAFLAGLLAAWPTPPGGEPATPATPAPTATAAPAQAYDPLAVWLALADSFRPVLAAQVRIEQHVVLRIAPMPGPARESLVAIAPAAPGPRLVERRMGDCLQMASIAGGQAQGSSRLLLFLRDRRLVAANLEKACSARDFYRGFYVDKPNADGKLCATRDRILARSGARCEISSFRLLVADD